MINRLKEISLKFLKSESFAKIKDYKQLINDKSNNLFHLLVVNSYEYQHSSFYLLTL